MNQRIEFFFPKNYSFGEITQSKEGWSYSPTDTQFGAWTQTAGDIVSYPSFVEWCSSRIKPDTLVIDVGANIGSHACRYLQLCRTLICVEPFPTSFECLRRNLLRQVSQLGSQVNISAFCGIVDYAAAQLPAPFNVDEQNQGSSHVCPTRAKAAGLYVPVTDIDNLVKERQVPVSMIKIDAEGYEGRILEGASDLLDAGRNSKRPDLVLEVNHGALARYGWNQDKLFGYLESIGYRLEDLWPPEYRPLSTESLQECPQYDCLWVPT